MLIIWLACVQCCAGALGRVCLSFGWRVCSAVRVELSRCAYHLAGFVFRVWGLRFRVYGAAVGGKRDLPLAENMTRSQACYERSCEGDTQCDLPLVETINRSQARCERSCAGVGKRDLPLAVHIYRSQACYERSCAGGGTRDLPLAVNMNRSQACYVSLFVKKS